MDDIERMFLLVTCIENQRKSRIDRDAMREFIRRRNNEGWRAPQPPAQRDLAD